MSIGVVIADVMIFFTADTSYPVDRLVDPVAGGKRIGSFRTDLITKKNTTVHAMRFIYSCKPKSGWG